MIYHFSSFRNILKQKRYHFCQDWYNTHITDPYTKQAQKMNYRSRAAFKLLEIIEKYKIFKQRNYRVLELGAAPGSWTQVLQRQLLKNSHIIALDQDPIKPLFLHKNQPRISYVEGDIYNHKTISNIKLLTEGKLFDVILSDMAPNISGVNDEFKVFSLNYRCIEVAQQLLKKRGTLVVKGFMNSKDPEFCQYLNLHFGKVNRFKPDSSRKKSNEIFYVNEEFKRTEYWTILNQKGHKLSLNELWEEIEQLQSKQLSEEFKESQVQIMKQRIIDEGISREQLKYQFEKELFDTAIKSETKIPLEKMSLYEAKIEAQKLLKLNPNNESLKILSEFPIEEHEIKQTMKELEIDSFTKLEKLAKAQQYNNSKLLDLDKETKKLGNKVEIIEEKDDPYKQALNELSPFDIQKLEEVIELLDEQEALGNDVNKMTMEQLLKIQEEKKEDIKTKYDYYKDVEKKEEQNEENRQIYNEFRQAMDDFEGDTYHQDKLMKMLDFKINEREYQEQKQLLIDQQKEKLILEEEQKEEEREEMADKEEFMYEKHQEKQKYQKYLNRTPRRQQYEQSKGKKKLDQLKNILNNKLVICIQHF